VGKAAYFIGVVAATVIRQRHSEMILCGVPERCLDKEPAHESIERSQPPFELTRSTNSANRGDSRAVVFCVGLRSLAVRAGARPT